MHLKHVWPLNFNSRRRKCLTIWFVATHVALRMFIVHFLANKNARLDIPPLFWPVDCLKIGEHVALLSCPTVHSLYCGFAFDNFVHPLKRCGKKYLNFHKNRCVLGNLTGGQNLKEFAFTNPPYWECEKKTAWVNGQEYMAAWFAEFKKLQNSHTDLLKSKNPEYMLPLQIHHF